MYELFGASGWRYNAIAAAYSACVSALHLRQSVKRNDVTASHARTPSRARPTTVSSEGFGSWIEIGSLRWVTDDESLMHTGTMVSPSAPVGHRTCSPSPSPVTSPYLTNTTASARWEPTSANVPPK